MKLLSFIIMSFIYSNSFAQEKESIPSVQPEVVEEQSSTELPSVEDLMKHKIQAYDQGKKIEQIEAVVSGNSSESVQKAPEQPAKELALHPSYHPLVEDGAKNLEAVPVYKIERVSEE